MTDALVVLDTNILVSALLSPSGNPAKIYRMFLTENLKVAYSSEIIAEYNDVLFRPYLQIPTEEAGKVLAAIQEQGKRIEPTPGTHYMVNEDDRIFYDTAKSTGSYLVTGNKKHYPDEAFIVTPAEFLSLCEDRL
jgi:putative PIN family toxin of toxin-antitoxin system